MSPFSWPATILVSKRHPSTGRLMIRSCETRHDEISRGDFVACPLIIRVLRQRSSWAMIFCVFPCAKRAAAAREMFYLTLRIQCAACVKNKQRNIADSIIVVRFLASPLHFRAKYHVSLVRLLVPLDVAYVLYNCTFRVICDLSFFPPPNYPSALTYFVL